MSRNIIIILMCHRHNILDLIEERCYVITETFLLCDAIFPNKIHNSELQGITQRKMLTIAECLIFHAHTRNKNFEFTRQPAGVRKVGAGPLLPYTSSSHAAYLVKHRDTFLPVPLRSAYYKKDI
jgi:hypothetical protein